ncbi:MAG: response regulator [Elusimicrobia bacterium]|nr:response regulator [Elusimicrobiota bacterium]
MLIVDDESDMRMALANVLARLGHEVVEAGDGPAALKVLAEQGADLVLLDLRLPGMDGIQILRRIRERDAETPVIMVTGYGSVESAMQVLQLGASHYLAKPFSNKELAETVERVLSAQKAAASAGVLGRRLAEKIHPTAAEGAALVPVQAQAPLRPGPWMGRLSKWLLLLGVLAAGTFLWPDLRQGLRRDYGTAYSHPAALVWQGERLWAADWLTQTVYQQELRAGRLSTVRSTLLARTHITGLAVSAEHVYISDSWARAIQKRKLDGRLTLVKSIPSPGPRPAGLFFDGRYLWSSDTLSGRIYQHELDEQLSVLASFPAAGKAPIAVFKDEGYLWSADADTRVLYQHRLDNQLRVIAVYSLPELDRGLQQLSCFAFRNGEVWLGRDGVDSMLRRRLDAFRKRETQVWR